MSVQTIALINETVEELRQMLVLKNQSYGDSALDPIRIFSSADPLEGIKIRLDDKLSRIKRGNELAGDNTIDDMIGYLVLLKVGRRLENMRNASNQPQEFEQHLNGGYSHAQAVYGLHPGQAGYEPPPSHEADPDPLASLAEGMEHWYANQSRVPA